MYRILKIGMDVHTTNFTLCALESKFGEEDVVLANITVGPDHKNILDFIRKIKEKMDPKGKDSIEPMDTYIKAKSNKRESSKSPPRGSFFSSVSGFFASRPLSEAP